MDVVYPHEHVLMRFNGHFGTVSNVLDRWSTGMRFGLPTAAPAYDPAKLQTFADACRSAAAIFHADAAALAGTACWFTSTSAAQIGVSGKYTPPGQLTVIGTGAAVAGTGTSVLPWNTALVVSLRTSIPRGRGSNGRVYWPCTSGAVSATTGRLSPANVTSRLTAFNTFVASCNTAANAYSAGMKLIVASNVGGGLYATVTKIRSDERLDSIERRENQQPSVWSTQNVL